MDIDDLESDQELPIIGNYVCSDKMGHSQIEVCHRSLISFLLVISVHRQDENRNHSQQDNDTDTNDDGVHEDVTPGDGIPMLGEK